MWLPLANERILKEAQVTFYERIIHLLIYSGTKLTSGVNSKLDCIHGEKRH